MQGWGRWQVEGMNHVRFGTEKGPIWHSPTTNGVNSNRLGGYSPHSELRGVADRPVVNK